MGNNHTTCCGQMKDGCRDICGCCPCKCCKTIETKAKLSKTIEHEVEKREIPFGRVLIHAGVRTTDNNYTSPVLEIHTWRKAWTQKMINEASMTKRNTADPHLGSLRGAVHRTVDVEEQIIVIPIESIISIRSSGEVKKGEIECRNVRVRTPPPFKLSFCEKIRQCCRTVCFCRDSSKNPLSKKPEEIITTLSDQKAQRYILITIEYIRYSNIDSPSHVRVLPPSDKAIFFNGHFHMDTLKFYLLNDDVFEQTDFDLKREQASTLCRLVTQLKAIAGSYPDELALDGIINNPDSLAIGEPAKETMTRFTGPGRITTTLELTMLTERF